MADPTADTSAIEAALWVPTTKSTPTKVWWKKAARDLLADNARLTAALEEAEDLARSRRLSNQAYCAVAAEYKADAATGRAERDMAQATADRRGELLRRALEWFEPVGFAADLQAAIVAELAGEGT